MMRSVLSMCIAGAHLMGSDLYNKLSDYLKTHLARLRTVSRSSLHRLPFFKRKRLLYMEFRINLFRAGIRKPIRPRLVAILHERVETVHDGSQLCQPVVRVPEPTLGQKGEG
jgi:hypothetical protein